MIVFVVCGIFALSASAAPRAALADALEKNDLVTARTLLRDSDVNLAQVDGMTALHWAVQHDDFATAKVLLAAHANPNAANRYGVTPLSLACTNGNAAMITLLLDAGADVNAPLRDSSPSKFSSPAAPPSTPRSATGRPR